MEMLLQTNTKDYANSIDQLSESSTKKFFLPYRDLDWDAAQNRIYPQDQRWELNNQDTLGATQWYQSQMPEVRTKIGLHFAVSKLKAGVAFESVLQRGLLAYAITLPNRSEEFRYAMHEVIEEANHSMMFQEFINRANIEDTPGIPWHIRTQEQRVINMGKSFPELFFFFVLAGEAPIDFDQRRRLRDNNNLHPLMSRIMRIHTIEESRHIQFAELFLRQRVPQLNSLKKLRLKIAIPLLLSQLAPLMMQLSKTSASELGVPQSVLDEAYTHNPSHKQRVSQSIDSIRILCDDLGLRDGLGLWLWRRAGIDI